MSHRRWSPRIYRDLSPQREIELAVAEKGGLVRSFCREMLCMRAVMVLPEERDRVVKGEIKTACDRHRWSRG